MKDREKHIEIADIKEKLCLSDFNQLILQREKEREAYILFYFYFLFFLIAVTHRHVRRTMTKVFPNLMWMWQTWHG